MRVWLAGATGYIGRAVCTRLLAEGHEVVALVRPGSPATARPSGDGVRVVEVTLTDPVAAARALAGIRADAVVSCMASRTGVAIDARRVDLDANRHLLDAARAAGAGTFVLLSAICVQRPRLAFQRMKLAFEAELQASGLRYAIVRPTAFFKSLAGQVERIRSGKPYLAFGGGRLTACKPISEADLAIYLVACLDDPGRQGRILPVGGPGPALTPLEQGRLIAAAAGVEFRMRSVPLRIFDLAEGVCAPLGRLVPRMAERAELARIGRYYATESMLLWDEARARYDADATPETGVETLEAFYRRVLEEGLAGQELGAARVFRSS